MCVCVCCACMRVHVHVCERARVSRYECAFEGSCVSVHMRMSTRVFDGVHVGVRV